MWTSCEVEFVKLRRIVDGFGFSVPRLIGFGLQLEGFTAGLILASVQRNTAKDKAEERQECLFSRQNCTWNWTGGRRGRRFRRPSGF
jgi:hypothetical protein